MIIKIEHDHYLKNLKLSKTIRSGKLSFWKRRAAICKQKSIDISNSDYL